jgi:hypothetical protein
MLDGWTLNTTRFIKLALPTKIITHYSSESTEEEKEPDILTRKK